MSQDRRLMLVSEARKALAECKSIGEVTEIRDKAEAVRAYLRLRGESLQAQNEAAEIKIRAERRAGEMLAAMELNGGDRKSDLHDARVKLPDIGVSHSESHRWQRIASIDDETFEAHIADRREASDELTTAGMIRLAKRTINDDRNAALSQESVVESDLQSLIDSGRKFKTIYADPPWKYGNQGTRAATDNHYPTLSVDEICELPIGELAEDQAHLHLWTTNAFIFDAKKVIEAWGFEYKSVLVWMKPQVGIGNYWRVNHEFLLLGVRGGFQFRDSDGAMQARMRSVVEHARIGHSRKPDLFAQMIERVSFGPFIELFARRARAGWSSWGNEVNPQFQHTFTEDQAA